MSMQPKSRGFELILLLNPRTFQKFFQAVILALISAASRTKIWNRCMKTEPLLSSILLIHVRRICNSKFHATNINKFELKFDLVPQA